MPKYTQLQAVLENVQAAHLTRAIKLRLQTVIHQSAEHVRTYLSFAITSHSHREVICVLVFL